MSEELAKVRQLDEEVRRLEDKVQRLREELGHAEEELRRLRDQDMQARRAALTSDPSNNPI